VSAWPLAIRVHGVPRPQGSLKLFRAKNGHEVAKYSDRTYEWRRIVTAAVRDAVGELEPLGSAVVLHALFELPRPAGHLGTGRNRGSVRASAPCWPTTAPDLDKLLRLVDDAITDAGVVWLDDAQVVEIRARKTYAAGTPGCSIRIYPAEEAPR
jgi:Holliday junction resolvase RusA-like endonuclease